MSVDPTQVGGGGGGGVKGFIEHNPTLALGGAIVAVLIGGGLVLKSKAKLSGATQTGAQAQDLSGITDANGNRIVYIPTSTQFTTINDASQKISVGDNSTGGSIINPPPNAGIKNPGGSMPPVRPKPPTPPKALTIKWEQHYTAHGQSLETISKNATISMANDAIKNKVAQRFEVNAKQLYDHNKGAVDSYLASQHSKKPVNPLNASLTGVTLIIPHLG